VRIGIHPWFTAYWLFDPNTHHRIDDEKWRTAMHVHDQGWMDIRAKAPSALVRLVRRDSSSENAGPNHFVQHRLCPSLQGIENRRPGWECNHHPLGIDCVFYFEASYIDVDMLVGKLNRLRPWRLLRMA
jgi:hypothetical protein